MKKAVKKSLVFLVSLGLTGGMASLAGPSLAFAASKSPMSAAVSAAARSKPSKPQVADTSTLKTWWHAGAFKSVSPTIAARQVRQSPFYSARVIEAGKPRKVYDSFTYLSLPRNGKGNDRKPGYTSTDGAEFASDAHMTMSWTSFEYSKDTWVNVSLTTGQRVSSVDQVTIRPRSLAFKKKLVDDHTVAIKVPASRTGYRFSVEFAPQVRMVYANAKDGLTIKKAEGKRRVESEPQNAMLVFAQPLVASSSTLIPADKGKTLYLKPGQVPNLDDTKAQVLYFKPGTYWMGSKYRALLPANVKWIYLAPGAYVKGAFRFLGGQQRLYKVTGYGVLSGEQYVYEADTEGGYDHRAANKDNCHSSCVKMLQFESTKGLEQKLTLQGVTIKEPPYHSFVVYGDEDSFKMDVSDYQQVGSWYWQTDGLELYKGSRMRHTFFHSNDDVLKLYHSDVSVRDTVIWKNENGPVIQWGWSPRNIDGITVDGTSIIHNRMYFNSVGYNTCIFNSSSHWEDMNSTTRADPSTTIRNLTFTNTTVEGMTNCAIRIYALSNTQNVRIKNFHVDAWNGQPYTLQQNVLKLFTNPQGKAVTLGGPEKGAKGLILENYTVGDETIRKAGDNWAIAEPGRINFDPATWDRWDAVASKEPSGQVPSLTVKGLTDGSVVASRTAHVSGTTNAGKVVADVNGKKTELPVSQGSYAGDLTLNLVENRVRITAYGDKGASASQRYSLTAYGNLVGSLKDPQGDDDGDGDYIYPTDGAFNKGSFDLTGVKVYRDGDKIRLVASMAGDVRNPWSANQMSTQRLNYYLSDTAVDAAPGDQAATTTPLLPGTNTNAAGAWRYAVVVDGRNADSQYGPGVYDKDGRKLGGIDLDVVGGRQVVASFDASLLGAFDLAKAGYQVSMYSSSEDGEGVGNVRPVYSLDCHKEVTCPAGTGDYRFGGGRGEVSDKSPFDTDLTDSNAIDAVTGSTDQHAVMKPVEGGPVLPYVVLDK